MSRTGGAAMHLLPRWSDRPKRRLWLPYLPPGWAGQTAAPQAWLPLCCRLCRNSPAGLPGLLAGRGSQVRFRPKPVGKPHL